MPQYAAVLGHQPHLSLAELQSAIPGFTLKRVYRDQVAIFDTATPVTEAKFARLGGTVILAERITENSVDVGDIPQITAKEVANVKRKITFGLRTYGIPAREIKNLYRSTKDILKHQNRPCRYIGNEKQAAATALLRDTEILGGKRGREIFVIAEEQSVWVGRTIAAQDIDAYTHRDMKKPVRDTTVGLLPPKLAQIMLNLGMWLATSGQQEVAGAQKAKKKEPVFTVFDPFCGTGVVPMEALLCGWNVLASDVSAKAVTGCQKNIDWLRKEKGILKKDVTDTVWKQDATKAFALKTKPDMIVTETSLGPALIKRLSQRDAQKVRNDNEKLQADFLRNASTALPGVPVVCSWPFWRIKGARVQMEKIWDVAAECGYTATLPSCVEPSAPGRLSVLYERRDQFVGREIVMLMPKKTAVSGQR